MITVDDDDDDDDNNDEDCSDNAGDKLKQTDTQRMGMAWTNFSYTAKFWANMFFRPIMFSLPEKKDDLSLCTSFCQPVLRGILVFCKSHQLQRPKSNPISTHL